MNKYDKQTHDQRRSIAMLVRLLYHLEVIHENHYFAVRFEVFT